MNVTILVWRVMGRAAMSFFLPRKSNRCHQLMKLHPFFVLNRYITIIIIQKPNEAGSMRYSGRVTISPVTGSSSGCVPKRLAKYMKRNSTQPVQKSRPPKNPQSRLARISFGEYADNHHRHTYRAHDKGRIVQNGLAHQMLHDNHQPVPQGMVNNTMRKEAMAFHQ